MAEHKPDDALEQSEPLKRLLTNLAQNYYEGDNGPVEVRWTDQASSAAMDLGTPVVKINVDAPWNIYDATGAHALRMLANTVSHEVEHHNESELDGKRDFMERHDDGYAKLAGAVINILEDNRIDYTRFSKYRGLKKVQQWSIQHQMTDDDRRPPMGELEPRQQVLEGFTQLAFAGKVKGVSDADPAVQDALSDVAPMCEQIKRTPDPDERKQIADDVTQRLRDVIPKTPDLPEFLKDLLKEIAEDLETDFDPEEAPADESFDPEDAEESADGGDGSGGDAADEAGDDAADGADADEMVDSAGPGESADGDGDGDEEAGGGDADEGESEAGDTQTIGDNRSVDDLTSGRVDPSKIRIVEE